MRGIQTRGSRRGSRPLVAIAAALAVLALSACGTAKLVHKPVDPDNDTGKGIRYFRTSPYLVLYSNGKGGIEAQIHHLPDPTKMMSVEATAKNAKLETTLTFDNGTLTKSTATGDTTALPKAILAAVKTVAPALLGLLPPTDPEQATYSAPAPYIYKVEVSNEGDIYLEGAQGTQPINLTLLVKQQQASSKKTGAGAQVGEDAEEKEKR